MTDDERKLIDLIRKHDNPEQALITATAVILEFLKQLESSEPPSVVCLQECV